MTPVRGAARQLGLTSLNDFWQFLIMRRTTRMAVVLALGWMAYGASDASAAWDNVFQTTCCGGNSTRSSYFAPSPAPACCPSVSYVQRCYYQPVTTYKTESYYEPVTSYRTSYYWQP